MQNLPVKQWMAAVVLLSVCCLVTSDLAGASKHSGSDTQRTAPLSRPAATTYTCAIIGDGQSPGVYRFTGSPPTLYELADRAGMLEGSSRIALKVVNGNSDRRAFHVFDPRNAANHDMTLQTGDVVIATASSPQKSVFSEAGQLRDTAYLCLVGVLDEPIVVPMPQSGATVDLLMEVYLQQPKELAESVRVIGRHSQNQYTGQTRGSRLLLDGAVVIFDREALDLAVLPKFPPVIEVTERTSFQERLAAARQQAGSVQLSAPTEIEPEIAPLPPATSEPLIISSRRFESPAMRASTRSREDQQTNAASDVQSLAGNRSSDSSTSNTWMTVGAIIALAGAVMLMVQHRRRIRQTRSRLSARIQTFTKKSQQSSHNRKTNAAREMLPEPHAPITTPAPMTSASEIRSELVARSDEPHEQSQAPVLVKTTSVKPETLNHPAAATPDPSTLMHRVLRQVQGKTQE